MAGWNTPKTDWADTDQVVHTDMNSIEENTEYLKNTMHISGTIIQPAAAIAAGYTKLMQAVRFIVPAYKKLYLTRWAWFVGDVGANGDLRLVVDYSGWGFPLVSSAFQGDNDYSDFSVQIYDNSASASTQALTLRVLVKNVGGVARTPIDYDGWSVQVTTGD